MKNNLRFSNNPPISLAHLKRIKKVHRRSDRPPGAPWLLGPTGDPPGGLAAERAVPAAAQLQFAAEPERFPVA